MSTNINIPTGASYELQGEYGISSSVSYCSPILFTHNISQDSSNKITYDSSIGLFEINEPDKYLIN